MSSLSLISVWGSTNENLYHSCYIVFQYVMMKIIKCVYIHVILDWLDTDEKCWCETNSIKCSLF